MDSYSPLSVLASVEEGLSGSGAGLRSRELAMEPCGFVSRDIPNVNAVDSHRDRVTVVLVRGFGLEDCQQGAAPLAGLHRELPAMLSSDFLTRRLVMDRAGNDEVVRGGENDQLPSEESHVLTLSKATAA